MDYKFIPSVCVEQKEDVEINGEIKEQITAPIMKGHVTLIVPTFAQRQKLRNIALAIAQSEGKEQGHMAMEKIVEMVEFSKPFYKEIDLEMLDGSAQFKTFEELNLDPRAESILKEVATALSRGLTIPKPL